MKVIVLMKQTYDTEAKIELNSKGQISNEGIKYIMNPYDEYAIEESVSMKETYGGEVTVISLGQETVVDSLRQALAMGCDNAVLLDDKKFVQGDGYSTANALAAAIKKYDFDLIIAGWVSVDEGAGQAAVRIAELLNLPQVTVVTKMQVIEDKLIVDREIDSGTEKMEVVLPAMITVQKGINEPRYPNMRGIMQAKKKKITRIDLAGIDLEETDVGELGSKTIIEKTVLPQKRQQCKIMKDDLPSKLAGKLVSELRQAKAL